MSVALPTTPGALLAAVLDDLELVPEDRLTAKLTISLVMFDRYGEEPGVKRTRSLQYEAGEWQRGAILEEWA